MKAHIIRILVTLGLIYGAYTETGVWTTLALLLIAVSVELLAITVRRMQ